MLVTCLYYRSTDKKISEGRTYEVEKEITGKFNTTLYILKGVGGSFNSQRFKVMVKK